VLPHPLLQINFKKNELAQNLPVSIKKI